MHTRCWTKVAFDLLKIPKIIDIHISTLLMDLIQTMSKLSAEANGVNGEPNGFLEWLSGWSILQKII